MRDVIMNVITLGIVVVSVILLNVMAPAVSGTNFDSSKSVTGQELERV
jgi:hypothetical protein